MSNHNYPIKPSLINSWSARLAEQVPLCPCPPETSPLDEVDGGILIRVYTQHSIDDPLRSEVVFIPHETAE